MANEVEKRLWLIEMRRQRNLSQTQAAFYIDINATYLDKIENGHRRPSPEVAQKIAHFYGFDWTRFFPPVSA